MESSHGRTAALTKGKEFCWDLTRLYAAGDEERRRRAGREFGQLLHEEIYSASWTEEWKSKGGNGPRFFIFFFWFFGYWVSGAANFSKELETCGIFGCVGKGRR